MGLLPIRTSDPEASTTGMEKGFQIYQHAGKVEESRNKLAVSITKVLSAHTKDEMVLACPMEVVPRATLQGNSAW